MTRKSDSRDKEKDVYIPPKAPNRAEPPSLAGSKDEA
jgi:hypothetical protein